MKKSELIALLFAHTERLKKERDKVNNTMLLNIKDIKEGWLEPQAFVDNMPSLMSHMIFHLNEWRKLRDQLYDEFEPEVVEHYLAESNF